MSNYQAIQDIEAAKAVIADPEHFIQNRLWDVAKKKFCIRGAVMKVCSNSSDSHYFDEWDYDKKRFYRAEKFLEAAALGAYYKERNFAYFDHIGVNNELGHAAILEVCDIAVDMARAGVNL